MAGAAGVDGAVGAVPEPVGVVRRSGTAAGALGAGAVEAAGAMGATDVIGPERGCAASSGRPAEPGPATGPVEAPPGAADRCTATGAGAAVRRAGAAEAEAGVEAEVGAEAEAGGEPAGRLRSGVPDGRGATGAVRDTGADAADGAVVTGGVEPTSGATGAGADGSAVGASAAAVVPADDRWTTGAGAGADAGADRVGPATGAGVPGTAGRGPEPAGPAEEGEGDGDGAGVLTDCRCTGSARAGPPAGPAEPEAPDDGSLRPGRTTGAGADA
ncbi:hypothetical protein [Streptomyces sp. NPDC056987]|uniref:hypothetical protein n=1 Tax=Streptomyces sp. NPDC056987 TaxID=3345988 RepID=UPI003632E6A9